MNEIIGGEFSIDPIGYLQGISRVEDIYTPTDGGVLFSSGRAALAGILRSIGNVGHVWLPDYLCTSITATVESENAFTTIQEQNAVLLINYFGIVDTLPIASELKKQKKDTIIIMDNVQALFQDRVLQDVDFIFTSFRKWLPVPDGAEVYAKSNQVVPFTGDNKFAQYKFAGNILKTFRQDISDDIALDLLKQGETILDLDFYCQCSEITRKILPEIDMDFIKKKRMSNARYLHEGLQKLGIKHLWTENAVPLFLPVFVKDRNYIRKKCFEHNIFCPVHWPNESNEVKEGNELYATELSLICDQRYDTEDMKKILKVIEQCIAR